MIDLENCKKLFEEYINDYDMNNFKMRLKKDHTFRVMNLSKELALSLNLTDEEVNIASLIGLLHDIGRFEQLKIYDTFDDNNSIDHANLGVQILKNKNYIKKYVKNENAWGTIFTAIENHNKLVIEDGLEEKTLLFCKIIRDADKLDILDLYRMGDLQIDSDFGVISDRCFKQFMSRQQVNRKDVKTRIDYTLGICSFLFDFNFTYSFKYIEEHNSVMWIIDKLMQYTPHERKKLIQAKEFIQKELEKRGQKTC